MTSIKHEMTSIKNNFQSSLDNIFGKKRLFVRIIHDDRDICINSNEREILYAIQEYQKINYNQHWSFSERFLTKALIISIDKTCECQFNGISETYKKYFQERIQVIINKYDQKYQGSAIFVTEYNEKIIEVMENFVLVDKNISIKYEDVKQVYQKLLSEKNVNYEKYKIIRDIFERMRGYSLIIGE